MKKVIMLCMSLCLALTLAACTSKEEASNEMKKIGIIQLVDHPSLNMIKEATMEQLEVEGYVDGETAEIYFHNTNSDLSLLPTILEQLKNDDVDVIIAITTPIAQGAAAISDEIPVIFAAVSDPVGAKLMNDIDEVTTVTGTSDEVQVSIILDLATTLYPDTKTIGYIYNSGEANSVSNLDKVKDYADANDLEVKEISVTNATEIQSAMEQLTTQADIIFSPTDNTVASAMVQAGAIAKDANIPFFVGADTMAQDGGFLTVGINYVELGKETANMAIQVLNGTPVKDIPVKIFKDDLKAYMNQTTADALGFDQMDIIEENYELVIFE